MQVQEHLIGLKTLGNKTFGSGLSANEPWPFSVIRECHILYSLHFEIYDIEDRLELISLF